MTSWLLHARDVTPGGDLTGAVQMIKMVNNKKIFIQQESYLNQWRKEKEATKTLKQNETKPPWQVKSEPSGSPDMMGRAVFQECGDYRIFPSIRRT